MTAAELRDIFLSAEYKQELEELSSYLASIMQERPIIFLLAKYLWKRKYKFRLEDAHQDLFVNGKHLEFKFNYDKMGEVLKAELAKWDNLEEMWAAVQSGRKRKSLGVMARIYKDVCHKKPETDILVWIICSRDLSKVNDADEKRICDWRKQRKYNKEHAHNSDREFLTVADLFLEKMQAVRPFSILKEEIATCGYFPSIYYFRICEFSKTT